MFDCAIQLIIEFVNIIPAGVVIVLVFNLISDLLWGK